MRADWRRTQLTGKPSRCLQRLPSVVMLIALLGLPGCVLLPPQTVAQAGSDGTGTIDQPASTTPGIETGAAKPAKDMALPGVLEGREPERRMTATLLQSELLAFADRYLEAVAEAADWGADHTSDPRARAAFRQTKVIYVTGAVTTANEPDPLRVLRDFLVLLRLQVMVWAGGGHAWAAPEAAARMLRALTTLEGQIVALAYRVLPATAVELVQELTQDWRSANPDRRYVAFVRFHDFGDSEVRRRFEAHVNAQGLLAPVAQASEEIQEMRRVAERGMFLANHMPLLLEWQAEAFLYNVLRVPELRAALGDLNRFASTAEGVAAEIAALPDRVAAERAAAMENLGLVLRRERVAALEQFTSQLRAQREGLFRDLNASADELLPLAEQFALAATGMRETMTLVSGMRRGNSGESGGFGMPDAEILVQSTTELVGETYMLAQVVQELLATEPSASGLERIDGLLRVHEKRLFGYASGLILIAGAVVCVVIVVLRRTTR